MATRIWTRGVAEVRYATNGCVFSGVPFVAGERHVCLLDRDFPIGDALRYDENGRVFAESESVYVREAHRWVCAGTREMENSLIGVTYIGRFVR